MYRNKTWFTYWLFFYCLNSGSYDPYNSIFLIKNNPTALPMKKIVFHNKKRRIKKHCLPAYLRCTKIICISLHETCVPNNFNWFTDFQVSTVA